VEVEEGGTMELHEEMAQPCYPLPCACELLLVVVGRKKEGGEREKKVRKGKEKQNGKRKWKKIQT
jgi:hypothetical protein